MTRVAAVGDIPDGEARRFLVDGEEVAIVNAGGHYYAVGDICSHEHFHLSDGEVDLEALTLECPKHGSAFDLATGEPQSLPAILPVPVYGVRVVGQDIEVEVLSGVPSGGRAG